MHQRPSRGRRELRAALPPDDKRIVSTVLAIADELTQDGLVLRYKVEGTDTGFDGQEGTFTICSFWLVTALTMIGETERAHALCQKLLSFAGPLMLYAEEIDATTGQHLGNFPQAFTHLALIEAVSLLIESDHAGNTGPAYNPPPLYRGETRHQPQPLGQVGLVPGAVGLVPGVVIRAVVSSVRSGRSSSAPARKHSAPRGARARPAGLAVVALSGWVSLPWPERATTRIGYETDRWLKEPRW